MFQVTLDVDQWAQQQFGRCDFGDKRRTQRLVTMAAQFAQRPDGSTPDQTENWADLKATYRFFDNDAVDHRAILKPHFKNTRDLTQQLGGTVLLVADTTEIQFGIHRDVEGLGPTGDGGGRGFFLHSSLAVDRNTGEALGLIEQDLFHRQEAPEGETRTQKLARERESEVWGRIVDAVGTAPQGTVFRHVFDAGSDNYELFCHLIKSECQWVLRAAQKHRIVLTTDGERLPLQEALSAQPVCCRKKVTVKPQPGQVGRTAEVDVRFVAISIPRPRSTTPWVREQGASSIAMSAVELIEADPPAGSDALHWVLLTSDQVTDATGALQVIADYEKRWVVEEFHKATKTGCRVESRQYATSARLERVTAVQCVVAVRLLQLRSHARLTPDRAALEVVPQEWVEVVGATRHRGRRCTPSTMTVRDFYRSLAKLGGFLGRKRDGEPGWITIWRGFEKLQLILRGVEFARTRCG